MIIRTDALTHEEHLTIVTERIALARHPDHFPDLMELLLEEYERTGGDAHSGEDGSYNSNLHLLMTWQAAEYEQAMKFKPVPARRNELYQSFLRSFVRVVHAELGNIVLNETS
ncbi:MAG: hypothetical protein INR69_01980 [Mucilaginibacter polytrichastri]|nr:hypothetical protein [Mucilaginibacter polytrichastri]